MDIPKYYSISQTIIEQITSGKLQPGMKVPSENEIIRNFHVSNTTARKTLNEIVQKGYAYQVKGKGTFVHTKNIERSATRILGFSRNMIEAGHIPTTRLLESAVSAKNHSDVVNGRKYTLKAPLLRIRRLRYADDIPMMLETRYISLALCPGIQDSNLSSSLYKIYQNEMGLKLSAVNQMIRTIIISDMLTEELFDISEPTPAFLVNGVTFCGQELVLEIEKSIYRGDKYTFSVRAT